MKPFSSGDRLTVTDASGVPLGTAGIDRAEGGLVLGAFRPAPAFATVADLFRQFEEHVEAAALAVLPALEQRIAALNLRVGRSGEPTVAADDVQIYSDGGFSCRPAVPADSNGAPAQRLAVVTT